MHQDDGAGSSVIDARDVLKDSKLGTNSSVRQPADARHTDGAEADAHKVQGAVGAHPMYVGASKQRGVKLGNLRGGALSTNTP